MSRFSNLKQKLFDSNSFLIFSITVLFLAPLLIFCLSAYRGYQRELENARANTQSLATAVERHALEVLRFADSTMLEIMSFWSDPSVLKKMGSKKASFALDEIAKRYPYAELIAITNSKGEYLANSAWAHDYDRLSTTGKTLAQRPHFLRHQAESNAGLIITEPIPSMTTGNLVVALSRRMPSPDSSFNGIIVFAINVKKFSDLFAQIARSNHDAITLWNENRVLLARYPYLEETIGKKVPMNPKMLPLVQQGNRFGSYEGKSTVDGISRIFSFRMVEQFPFSVVVGTDTSEVIGSWLKSVIFMALSGALPAFIGMFLLFQYLKGLRLANSQRAAVAHTSKMASLGEMASGIAHEINNPLAIISGKATQIVKSIERGQPDLQVVKDHAVKIDSTVNRIAKIIAGLRSFARDTKADPMAPASLREIVEGTLALSSERFKFNNVALEVSLPEDFKIWCREAEISQVLLNLLNNAFDAVSPLSEKWVRVSAEASNRFVTLKVSDSGRGIPADVAEKMMNPFFTTKPVGQGTGLGLSISKGIIEAHGGKFYLKSESANTTFIIILPIYSA